MLVYLGDGTPGQLSLLTLLENCFPFWYMALFSSQAKIPTVTKQSLLLEVLESYKPPKTRGKKKERKKRAVYTLLNNSNLTWPKHIITGMH